MPSTGRRDVMSTTVCRPVAFEDDALHALALGRGKQRVEVLAGYGDDAEAVAEVQAFRELPACET